MSATSSVLEECDTCYLYQYACCDSCLFPQCLSHLMLAHSSLSFLASLHFNIHTHTTAGAVGACLSSPYIHPKCPLLDPAL